MKPWISKWTLALIEERDIIRLFGDRQSELEMNKEIKKSAKNDRVKFLDDMLKDEDWSQIKKLRKSFSRPNGRIRNLDGELVESSQRGETLAEYFEKIQWSVQFPDLMPNNNIMFTTPLSINEDDISTEEVKTALKSMKQGRASGIDELPSDLWKALLASEFATEELRKLLNKC